MTMRHYTVTQNGARSVAQHASLVALTATLTAAYISRNTVTPSHISTVISHIHSALKALQLAAMQDAALQRPTNSEIAASIKYDRLTSFIDGKAYKSLQRHLAAHGMTPDQYRARYSLPKEYPMVSPSYSTVRSRIAGRAYSRIEVT